MAGLMQDTLKLRYDMGYRDGLEDAKNKEGCLTYSIQSKIKISTAVESLNSTINRINDGTGSLWAEEQLSERAYKLIDILIEELNL